MLDTHVATDRSAAFSNLSGSARGLSIRLFAAMFDSEDEFFDPVGAEQDFMEEELQFQECSEGIEPPPSSPFDEWQHAKLTDHETHVADTPAAAPVPQAGTKRDVPKPVEAQTACLPLMQEASAPADRVCKRPRLRTKTSPLEQRTVPLAVAASTVHSADLLDPEWWRVLSSADRNAHCNTLLKTTAHQEYAQACCKSTQGICTIPHYWSKVNKRDRSMVASWFLTKGSGALLPAAVSKHISQMYPPKLLGRPTDEEAMQKMRRLQGTQFMFTCQGEWGVFPPHLVDAQSVPLALCDAVEQVRNTYEGPKVWLKVRQEAIRFTTWLGVKDWSICLEICPKSLRQKREIRLHAHLAVMFERKRDFKMDARQFTFLGGGIHISEAEISLRRKVGWGAFYYVSAPKISQLWSISTKLPFDEYPVNMQWIWNLLQASKMSAEQARNELIKGAHRLPNHLPALERLKLEVANLKVMNRIEQKEEEFAKLRKPFKSIAPVDKLIADLTVPRERRKFLVLEGPSRVGKTQYALSLFGQKSTLEINAADEVHPSLQAFCAEEHRCILLDEASPEMVVTNRKLFQAPNALIQLAQSKTSCHMYRVYLNDTLICICSNAWQSKVDQLPASCRDWIMANQVLIRVTRPLWLA